MFENYPLALAVPLANPYSVHIAAMRRRAKVDANQAAITKQLRARGFSVEPRLSAVGKGVPDLLVGAHGMNFLIELKDSDKPASAKKLTEDEAAWHEAWRGQVSTCESLEEIIAVVKGDEA